ncbi:32847_t:CDS:2 [Gigaspora margarita]|uniref:32847_t:CDS:1 n=1 Tax=Gigaspora margarita TaxID=4874 RepID=A0ABN7W7M0_GIGMA|nr:32847_t:CDS:2 [Gigaspora margarita]
MDPSLVESVFPNQEFQYSTQDLEAAKKSFHQLANILILPLEYGSGYYWEVQQIYLNTNKKKLTSCATQQHALVQCSHQLAHEHPQYRQFEFLAVAKEWIRDNIKYHLQSSEIYGHLQQHGFINAKANIHVPFNKSALINKKYLEEQQGFKVIYYVENNFVRALGFTTLLLDCIGIKNIKKVVIDSTFKTNQERFELFVVNANCGGLQNEGLFPTFVLLDKDAGEISPPKLSGYSKEKSAEACCQFDFIDPSWIPDNRAGSLCSDDHIKKIVNIVKQYANMHPLIPDNNLFELWSYLWVNKKDWKLFACSAYSQAMPLAQTTMIIESYYFPSWWQAFKNDWDKHATTNIEPGMEERYHIDLLKKMENIFLPTFKKTKHHHDYLLIAFDADITIPTICQENDPWKINRLSIINNSKELSTSSSNLQNIMLKTRYNTIDEIKEKLA